jgi:DNA-binding NarL/FixJ family response regulator
MTTTVLIAESHHLIRIGLHAVIEGTEGYQVVGHAVDGDDAVQKTKSLRPDLLVLDLHLLGNCGLDVAQQILRQRPQQIILALSPSRVATDASQALGAGCTGYLMTDATQEDVIQAIRALVSGRRFVSENLMEELLNEVQRTRSPSNRPRIENSLSPHERSVFKLIAEGGTNRSVANALGLSPKTIEKHRANLMRKLHVRSAIELVLLAVEMGIVQRRGAGRPPLAVRAATPAVTRSAE